MPPLQNHSHLDAAGRPPESADRHDAHRDRSAQSINQSKSLEIFESATIAGMTVMAIANDIHIFQCTFPVVLWSGL